MGNYIDIKVTTWQRLHFESTANMEEIKNELISGERNSFNICDEELGFISTEFLYDTEQQITVTENKGDATIEVYEGDELIWQNAK